MPTPRVPSGFRPAVAQYGYGAPSGAFMTVTGGGMPRISRRWSRGVVAYSVAMVMPRAKFNVWNAFFFKIIAAGGLQFHMPLDTFGGELEDHLCIMVPGSYRAEPVSGQLVWQVRFDIVAEPKTMNDMTVDEAEDLIDLWELFGDDLELILSLLTKIALYDLTKLQPVDDLSP